MGILDRVAGAVGVKRRHDGESVSKPLKFANLGDTGTTNGGKVVRQAPAQSPTPNPNCALPQSSLNPNNNCVERLSSEIRRQFNTYATAPYDANDPNWRPNSYRTCAAIACQTDRDIIESGPMDTRCAVSSPPQAWTLPIASYLADRQLYANIPGTRRYISAYWTGGTYYRGANETYLYGSPFLSSIGAAEYDVDPNWCAAGVRDPAIVRVIQCDLGLRDCGPTAPSSINPPPSSARSSKSTQINILPTINPAPSINPIGRTSAPVVPILPTINPAPTLNPIKQTSAAVVPILPTIDPAVSINKPGHSSSIGIAAGLSTLATGAISTVAAYLSPTPTAVLAAAAPSGVITQIALGVGLFGGGAVIAGAGYGAYKFAQWLRSHPFQNTGGSIEDAIAFAKLAEEEAQQDAVSVAGEFEDPQATPEPASFTELRRAIAAGEITADDIQRVLGSIDLGQLRVQLSPPAYEEVVTQ